MQKLSLLILLFTLGCKAKPQPDAVLPPPKMQAVMWDLMQADELAEYQNRKDSLLNLYQLQTTEYSKVLALHGLRKEVFQQSLKYYRTRPDLLKPIFDSLQKKSELYFSSTAPK